MKKVLIAFDGTQFSEGAFEFARRLNELQPILLTGVFTPYLSYANIWSFGGEMVGAGHLPLIEEVDSITVENHIRRFEKRCIDNGIAFRTHKDFMDFAEPEIKRETSFADLLILGSERFFEDLLQDEPGYHLQHVLQVAECPVVIVPEKYAFPERNILSYNGGSASVYAIKQFAYLFPELAAQDSVLVFFSNEPGQDLPNKQEVIELVTQHFRNLNVSRIELDPSKFLDTWLMENENSMLICGSYGRSSLSQTFRKSFVSEVIATHRMPVFIAHK